MKISNLKLYFRLDSIIFLAALVIFFSISHYIDKVALFAAYMRLPVNYTSTTDFTNFRASVFLSILIIYISTFTIGAALWGKSLAKFNAFWPRFGGAFLLGYLSQLCLFRILSLFIGGNLLWVFVLLVSLFLAVSRKQHLIEFFKPTGESFLGLLIQFMLVILILISLLALQFWQVVFTWVGHGTSQYAYLLKFFLDPQKFQVFPIIELHHEELLFSYVIEGITTLNYDPILPAWITLGVAKVAAMGFIYGCFSLFRLPRWLLIPSVAFMFYGSMHANLLKYMILFDSGNPLAYVAHTGRLMGIPFAIFLLCYGLKYGVEKIPSIPLAICAAGFTITTASNGFMTWILFLSMILLTQYKRGKFETEKTISRIDGVLIIVPIIIGLLSAQAYRVGTVLSGQILPIGFTLLLPLGCLLYVYLYIRRNAHLLNKAALKPLVIFSVSLIFGFIFFGNVLSRNIFLESLVQFLNKYHLSSVHFFNFYNASFKSVNFFVDAREIGDHTQYSQGASRFWSHYGLFFFMGSLSLYSLCRQKMNHLKRHAMLFVLLGMGLMPAIFFQIDFVDHGERAWIKTRFLEVPFYVFFASFILFIALSGGRRIRHILAFLLTLLTITPLFYTCRLGQWMENFLYLCDLFKRTI